MVTSWGFYFRYAPRTIPHKDYAQEDSDVRQEVQGQVAL